MTRDRLRTSLLLVVAAVALAAGIVAHATGVLRGPELATVDARFDVRGTQDPPAGVALVGIDTRTLRRLNVRPPLPRSLHARVIDRLRRAGARVIAYDLQFTEPTDPDEDSALLEAVERAGTVVLATARVGPRGETDVFDREETVRAVRATVGSTNFPERAARGGVLRRLPCDERGLPSFAVAAARRAGREVPRAWCAGDGAWIDVPGPAGTIPATPFVDVLEGRVPAAGFRGRVVVVGATDPILQDVVATAAGDGVPGAELQAAAIATLLRGAPLRDAGDGLVALLLALAALATPLAAIRLRGLRWLPVPAVLVVALPVAAQAAFAAGTVMPVAAPALALLVAAGGTLVVAYATDVRDRRRLRATFARFVPPQVVDEVVERAGGAARLGGVRRDGTVLFCDLRGFTAIAEHRPAEEVIDLLNVYLGEMSDAILDHGGTVVSYLGDGIMAVFGAPLAQPDHADRALAAAREMLEVRLPRVAERVAAAGVTEDLRIGIGLASGPVMSGNVGSDRRLEYTAVGDVTNTAARLQAMTKETGVPLLLTEATRAALRAADGAPLREVGPLVLRGRSEPVLAHTLADG